jgi:hypothetical protein
MPRRFACRAPCAVRVEVDEARVVAHAQRRLQRIARGAHAAAQPARLRRHHFSAVFKNVPQLRLPRRQARLRQQCAAGGAHVVAAEGYLEGKRFEAQARQEGCEGARVHGERHAHRGAQRGRGGVASALKRPRGVS